MNEAETEQAIKDAGKTAPRVTAQHIDSVITQQQYHVFPGTGVTVCCLTLANGYSVVGSSAPASRANYDKAIGEKLARSAARDRIWDLEGYLLRERLHTAEMNGD